VEKVSKAGSEFAARETLGESGRFFSRYPFKVIDFRAPPTPEKTAVKRSVSTITSCALTMAVTGAGAAIVTVLSTTGDSALPAVEEAAGTGGACFGPR